MLCAAAVPAFTNCPRTRGRVSARRRLLSYLTCSAKSNDECVHYTVHTFDENALAEVATH